MHIQFRFVVTYAFYCSCDSPSIDTVQRKITLIKRVTLCACRYPQKLSVLPVGSISLCRLVRCDTVGLYSNSKGPGYRVVQE
jgi:hypothetical protein